jgi:hypothetical protein
MRYDFKVENLADVRDKLARDIARVAGVISITLSLVATIALATTQSSNLFSLDSNAVENLLEPDYADSENTDESWVPVGFSVWWEDSNIAWKWTTDSVNYEGCDDCIYWIVDVVSKNGCPRGVYGSLNISRGDVILDWTNDTVPYLGPMETARLAFEKYGYDDAGSNYQGDLTTLNCR